MSLNERDIRFEHVDNHVRKYHRGELWVFIREVTGMDPGAVRRTAEAMQSRGKIPLSIAKHVAEDR